MDEQPEKTLPRSLVEKLIALALVFGLVGGVLGGWIWQHSGSSQSTISKQLVLQENSAVIDVAKKVSPAVVSITTESTVDNFFGYGQQVSGAGTGMIITADGLILTNKHVVPAGTQGVKVYTNDGKQFTGQVVARDPSNDLAFVKIDGSNLPTVEIGDSSKMEVGQKVIAIGNALGQFQNSVTMGIISGVGRPVEAGDESGSSESLQNLFQTDAAINPGNSGGPLVNLGGQVIGINTAIAGDAQNVGFAIPINEARPVITSYEKTKKISRPYLGVRYIQLTKEFAASQKLPVSDGAYLDPGGANPVVDGGPADKAGLKAGDIITKINSDSIDSRNSLTSLVGKYQPGDSVTLTIVRGGKTITTKATLTEAPAS